MISGQACSNGLCSPASHVSSVLLPRGAVKTHHLSAHLHYNSYIHTLEALFMGALSLSRRRWMIPAIHHNEHIRFKDNTVIGYVWWEPHPHNIYTRTSAVSLINTMWQLATTFVDDIQSLIHLCVMALDSAWGQVRQSGPQNVEKSIHHV